MFRRCPGRHEGETIERTKEGSEMPFWGWVLLIACLSVLLFAAVYAIVHHTHRRMPARQVTEGDALDLSAPLPSDVAEAMTARELEAEAEPRAHDPQLPTA
jgi:hypothetical protein